MLQSIVRRLGSGLLSFFRLTLGGSGGDDGGVGVSVDVGDGVGGGVGVLLG